MTIEKWYGPSHVALAAVRAAAANTATYASTYWTADPFITAGIPTTPTSYGANGAPNDGGYYMREMESADTPRIMPFAEFWIDGQPTPTEQMDGTPSPPSLDTGSAAPTDGNGVVSADAVAFIPVYQRLYDPAGIGGVST